MRTLVGMSSKRVNIYTLHPHIIYTWSMLINNFPDFSHISLDDKDEYNALVAQFPPLSDISFATLHVWWDLEGKLGLSLLNDNLVINYSLPFDDENSGLCLVGRTELESSIDTIFNYLRSSKKPVKLVHVPEFVVEQVKNKSIFFIKEEEDYNEYIIDSHALSSLEGSEHGRTRRKVNRFLRETESQKLSFKDLDLSDETARQQLFSAIIGWETENSIKNDPGRTEHSALNKTLQHADKLGIKHTGLYLDDKLYAVVLYHISHDGNHYTIHHLKVDYSIPYIFDYMTHHIANLASQNNVDFINMEMDLGIENLRNHKMGLRPVDFFRKYTITPKD